MPENPTKQASVSWRDVLPVHPAAEMFPLMNPEELPGLGADIERCGLKSPIILWSREENDTVYLLDGRNRLDALEAAGVCLVKDGKLDECALYSYGENPIVRLFGGCGVQRASDFEPAKSASPEGVVFTNCGKTEAQEASVKSAKKKLTRVPFTVSRLMEFCNRRELVNQTGHDVTEWALVVLKEGVDNAIDEAEEAGFAPAVHVEVKGNRITIADNGRGIPAAGRTRLKDRPAKALRVGPSPNRLSSAADS
jgi:hypothetical protein